MRSFGERTSRFATKKPQARSGSPISETSITSWSPAALTQVTPFISVKP